MQKFNINGEYLAILAVQSPCRDQGVVNFLLLQYTMRDCTLLNIVIVAFQCFSLMINSVALLDQDS